MTEQEIKIACAERMEGWTINLQSSNALPVIVIGVDIINQIPVIVITEDVDLKTIKELLLDVAAQL